MSEALVVAVQYINAILFIAMTYYAIASIFKPATKLRWILLACLGFVVVTTQTFFISGSMWINLIVNLSGIILIAFLFCGNVSTRIILAFLIYMTGMFAEMLANVLVNYIYHTQIGLIGMTEYLLPIGRSLTTIFQLPIILMMAFIFRKFVRRNVRGRHFVVPAKYTFAISLMLLIIVVLNAFFISIAITDVTVNIMRITLVQLLSSVLVVLIGWTYNIILLHLEKMEQSRQKDQMLERWELQYKTVRSTQEIVAKLKHNLKYHFLEILAFLDEEEFEEAKSYIKKEIGSFDYVVATGNISIDSILNYYQQQVKEKLQIEMEIKLNIPPDMDLKANLITLILGNALENAVEACEHVEISMRYISFKAVLSKQDELIITITNSFEIHPTVNSQGELVTHKEDKHNHGWGLASIRDALHTNEGEIHTNYEDGTFTFTLYIRQVSVKENDKHTT